jgi:ATP-binding cassette subfamily B protein
MSQPQSSPDRETQKAKEKKKRLPLKRSISNILFALRQVWEVAPLYFIMYYTMTFVWGALDFLEGSYLLRMIVSGIEKATPTRTIVTFMLVIAVADILAGALNSYYWNVVSPPKYQLVSATIRKKLFRKASQVELSCYETPAFYDKYMKAMDEANNRIEKVMGTIDNLIWNTISLCCNSFLLFLIDPVLILFGLFPLLLGIVRRWKNRVNHDMVAARKPIDRRVKYVRRTFYLGEYAKEMRIGGMYRRMLGELMCTYTDFRDMMRKYGLRLALAQYIQKVGLEVITILGAMLYAVWRTLSGGMTIGDCIVILNSIGTISYCLNYMVQNFAEFGEHSLFLEDVRYFLDYDVAMPEDENAPEAHGGDIELSNVSFRYTGAEQDTLHNVSMRIGAGERVALVGLNGSGKTTLVKLLLRLYDPTEGQVRMGGRDARDYRLSSYRNSFSCVFQDFRVFSMSVQENVLLRTPREGDRERVTEALRESGAWGKVESLPRGLDSVLTREFDENGINLSGGEAQKVSLARVFAEDAPFIILDEPSSALDPIAEHTMFRNMMRAAQGRGVLFISHRLATAVDADRIYLMDGGRIAEVGTHRELMERGGKYAEMFRLQAKNYVGEEVSAE